MNQKKEMKLVSNSGTISFWKRRDEVSERELDKEGRAECGSFWLTGLRNEPLAFVSSVLYETAELGQMNASALSQTNLEESV